MGKWDSGTGDGRRLEDRRLAKWGTGLKVKAGGTCLLLSVCEFSSRRAKKLKLESGFLQAEEQIGNWEPGLGARMLVAKAGG